MLDRGERALPRGCRQRPDLAQDGLQTNALFVNGPHSPELDGCLREGRRHLAQQRTWALLEVGLCLRLGPAAWACGSACTCRGRGIRGRGGIRSRAPRRRR
jgi:hypothetical protein